MTPRVAAADVAEAVDEVKRAMEDVGSSTLVDTSNTSSVDTDTRGEEVGRREGDEEAETAADAD